MIHDEKPVIDVERRIDVDGDAESDLTPIVEEYVFPESPNQVQRDEVVETLIQETDAAALESEVVEVLESPVSDADALESEVVEVLESPVSDADALEPILINAAPINRHRKPWSYSEISRLYREYQINRYTVDEIAEMHGRTHFAIVGKLKSENIFYNVSDEEEEYFESEEDEKDEKDEKDEEDEEDEEDEDKDESNDEEESFCQIHLPSAFLMLARAYCYAVEFVVDVAFAGVRHVYRTFVPRITEGRRKRTIR